MTFTLLTCNEPATEEDSHDPVQGMSFAGYIIFFSYVRYDPPDEGNETLEEQHHTKHQDVDGDHAFSRTFLVVLGTCVWNSRVGHAANNQLIHALVN